MQKTLAEIAKIVGGEVLGDQGLIITGLSGIQDAKEGDLTFLSNPKYSPLLRITKASAIIVGKNTKVAGKSVIQTDSPSQAFTKIALVLSKEEQRVMTGIHPTAVIAPDALIGKNVAIGPYVVVESKVQIGDGSIVYAGSYIGYKAVVGPQCLIYPHVIIRERVHIGRRVIVHSGTVIGSDGFGYEQIGGSHEKIPQIGTVIIEDDVEIGANVTIDRARFDKTVIGKGSKIDNLVQIAHNVVLGENCVIISQVGISGSTTIGKNSVLAGQSGVAGHLTIGEGSVVAAKSGVINSLPAFSKVSGFPAKPHLYAKRVNASLQRLPIYVKSLQDLKQKVSSIEEKLVLSSKKKPHKKK